MASAKPDRDSLSSYVLNLRPLSALIHPRKKRRSELPSTSSEVDSPNPDSRYRQGTAPSKNLLIQRACRSEVLRNGQVIGEFLLKFTVAFLAIPSLMAFIGYTTERILYGDGHNAVTFHRTAMVYSGLIAAPFILLRWCWKWPKHLIKLEMIFYIIHTTIVIITVLTTMIDGGKAHFIAEQIRDVFADPTYKSIRTDNDVYVYLDHLVRKIYSINSSNSDLGPLMMPLPGQLDLFGPIRLKQSRTKSKPCASTLNSIGVDTSTLKCFPQYSKDDEDREPYGEGIEFNFSNPSYFNYAGVEIKSSDIYTIGRLGLYPISGYWVLLPHNLLQQIVVDMVGSIKNASWIDRQTRQISIDFPILVKDLPSPIACFVVLNIEKSIAGKFLPMNPEISFTYAEYGVIGKKLNNGGCSKVTTQESFLRPMYLGVLPVAMYTLFSCLLQLLTLWRTFLTNVYSYVESTWICIVFLIIIFRWLSIYYVPCSPLKVSQKLWPSDDVIELDKTEVNLVGLYWHRARQLLSIGLFLYIFNSLKFLTKLTSFDTIGKTLGYAFRNLASFFVSFSVIFVAFVVMFYLLFSSADENYRSFTRSIGTVWMALLGNVDINNDLLVARETYLPLLIFFTFFLSFVLLTVVIAIVTDAFEKTKCELKKMKRTPSSTQGNGWQTILTQIRNQRQSRTSLYENKYAAGV